ncbi:hypothetical protein D3C87_1207810 [compost metagenome]
MLVYIIELPLPVQGFIVCRFGIIISKRILLAIEGYKGDVWFFFSLVHDLWIFPVIVLCISRCEVAGNDQYCTNFSEIHWCDLVFKSFEKLTCASGKLPFKLLCNAGNGIIIP